MCGTSAAPPSRWYGHCLPLSVISLNLCPGPQSFTLRLSFFLTCGSFLPHHQSSQKFSPYHHLPFLDSHPNSHRVDCIRGPQVPVFVGSSSNFLVMCDDLPVALGPEATSLQLTRTLIFCLLTTPTSWASRPLFFTWSPPSFLLLLSLSMQS